MFSGDQQIRTLDKDNRAYMVINADGFPVDIKTASGDSVQIDATSVVDEGNSTNTPLGTGETFTGDAKEILNYAGISLFVNSDVSSDPGGLVVQFSADGINWYNGESYTIPANATKFFTPPVQAKYYRVKYTNDGSPQTNFDIHTILHKTTIKWSSHNIQDNLNDQDDGELVVSVLKLRTAQNNYVSGSATNNGNFKVSLEELESGISSNNNSQLNTTAFHADGAEGNLITGFDYVAGKSGIDSATETLQTIAYEHHEIHSGSHYLISNVEDLAINNVYDIQITTPDTTKRAHFTFKLECESETERYLYEDVTINTNGTLMTPINNNRNSLNTSGLIIAGILNTGLTGANADTAVAGATTIENGVIGAGKTGGSDKRDNEIILKQNTKYSLRFIASTAGYIYYSLNRYEHTNKN